MRARGGGCRGQEEQRDRFQRANNRSRREDQYLRGWGRRMGGKGAHSNWGRVPAGDVLKANFVHLVVTGMEVGSRRVACEMRGIAYQL